MTNLVLNGKAIDSVASIADNYNEAELVKAFKKGWLADWLYENGEEDIRQSLREINENSKNLASAIIKVLGLDLQLCSKAEKKAKAEKEAIAKRKEEEALKTKEENARKAKAEKEAIAKRKKEEEARKAKEEEARRAKAVQAAIEKRKKEEEARKAKEEEARKETERRAECGDIEAAYQIACHYYKTGAHDKAKQFFEIAAESGHAEAQNMLGCCFINGEGVRKNRKKALKWFKLAAKGNDPYGAYNAGLCYYNNEGLDLDGDDEGLTEADDIDIARMHKASRYFHKAKKLGHKDAEEYINNVRETLKEWREAARASENDDEQSGSVVQYEPQNTPVRKSGEAAKAGFWIGAGLGLLAGPVGAVAGGLIGRYVGKVLDGQ